MNKAGPIIIIEDDDDDRYLISLVFEELQYPNKLVFFADGLKALAYLQDDHVYPFLILSDVNLPKLNGFELRKHVHGNKSLAVKCIPYLFFSTSVGKRVVCDAYTMSVQGFFKKPKGFEHLKKTMKTIVEYWLECYSPNNYTEL